MQHLRQFLLNRIEQTENIEEVEILATFCALVNYAEYVKELNPAFHKRAMDFAFETVDIPGISFTQDETQH